MDCGMTGRNDTGTPIAPSQARRQATVSAHRCRLRRRLFLQDLFPSKLLAGGTLAAALWLAGPASPTPTRAQDVPAKPAPAKQEPAKQAPSKPTAGPAESSNKGQATLDQATELQLNAESVEDLEKVATLAETALEKGLDKENQEFAKQLIVSTLLDRARRITASVLGRQPPNPQWMVLRGFAIKDLDRALKHAPEDAEVHLLRARLHALPGGDRQAGLKSADAAIAALRAENDAQESLAEAYVARAALTEDATKRLKDLDAAIATDPTNSDAWQARALHHLAAGAADKAIADLKQLVEQDGDNPATRLALAEALISAKKLDEALVQVDAAISKRPQLSVSHLLKARILAAQDKLAAAVEAASKAFEVEPRDLNALMLRAQLYIQQDKFEPALADLNRILQARPGQPQALLIRSSVYVDQKKFVEAIRDLRELARMNPDNDLVRLQAAQIYVAGGWPRFAIQILGGILATNPENASALRSRGDAYLNIGRHADAIADFDKALALDPNNSGILNNLAWVLATSPDDKLRDPERSIKLATKACELTDYKAAHILSTLASGYAEKGDFEMALKWSSKAVELSQGESKDQLKKELENYQQKKPWRERQETAEKPNPPPLDEGQEL